MSGRHKHSWRKKGNVKRCVDRSCGKEKRIGLGPAPAVTLKDLWPEDGDDDDQ